MPISWLIAEIATSEQVQHPSKGAWFHSFSGITYCLALKSCLEEVIIHFKFLLKR